jgi:hypothetical protein
VDATDNLSHAGFSVQVLAYAGAQTATNAINLAFTQASLLSCNISYATGGYHVGDTVGVNVVASTGETLNITYFSAPDATVLESFAAFPKLLQYSTAGTKYFYALAKSAATGQLCNGGALLQSSIQILPNASTPSCTVTTGPNPAFAGTYFNVFATPSSPNGYQRIYIVNATDATTGSQAYGQWHYGATALSAQAVMFVPGTYNVTVTILDELNNATSSCVTQQQIN